MKRTTLLLATAAALPAPAFAQGTEAVAEPPAEQVTLVAGARVYTPADFARFSPTTALDMVERIPGFVIEEGETRRGLGQGGDNILINGERVSGKSNDAVTTLRRIAAANVERIEVRDAASLDIPGLSGQVVNIVTGSTGLTGNFSWQPEVALALIEPRLYSGEISITGQTGDFEYTLGLANTQQTFRDAEGGIELELDPGGNITDVRNEVGRFYGDRPRFSGNLVYDGPGGVRANLNASYEFYDFRGREDSVRMGIGRPDRLRLFRIREDKSEYEISGDIEFGLGPGRLKLIGLRNVEEGPLDTSAVIEFADGTPSTGTRFVQDLTESEWIARGEYSFALGGDWQFALEGALNTLDAASQLFVLQPDGEFDPIPLPNANSRVEEERAEANITYGRQLAEGLALQTSIGGEYSKLTQSGPAGLVRTFYRPKGFVSLAWQATERLDIRLRVEREVGQLDFEDFVASVNLQNENEDAGNPNLVPPQSWNYELEATQQLGAFGSITARLFYEDISDIVDQVPIGLTGEAPGNLDSAKRYGLQWNSTFNFEPLGLEGVRLDLELILQRSKLTDPLTGESRPISFDRRTFFRAEPRYDIPGGDWAIGGEIRYYAESDEFRLGSRGSFAEGSPFFGAYVENKDVFGLRLRGGIYNFTDRDRLFRQTVYVARRDGPIDFIEDREREFTPFLAFQVSGSF